MASSTLARNPITGTLGVQVSDLSDNWDEAEMQLKERECDLEDRVIPPPQLVAAMVSWGRVAYGIKAVKAMSLNELEDRWHAFA